LIMKHVFLEPSGGIPTEAPGCDDRNFLNHNHLLILAG
jgi:hypothetical protein